MAIKIQGTEIVGDNRQLISYRENVVTQTSGSIDLSASNVFDLTLQTSFITVSFINPPASGILKFFTIIVRQGGTTVVNTLTWPTNIKWSFNEEPELTEVTGRYDVLTFFTIDGGATYAGALSFGAKTGRG